MNPHRGNPGPPPGRAPDGIEELLEAIPDPPVPEHLSQALMANLPVSIGPAAGSGPAIAALCAIGGLGLAALLTLAVLFGPGTAARVQPESWALREPLQRTPVVIRAGITNSSHIILKDTNPCRTLPEFCN